MILRQLVKLEDLPGVTVVLQVSPFEVLIYLSYLSSLV